MLETWEATGKCKRKWSFENHKRKLGKDQARSNKFGNAGGLEVSERGMSRERQRRGEGGGWEGGVPESFSVFLGRGLALLDIISEELRPESVHKEHGLLPVAAVGDGVKGG